MMKNTFRFVSIVPLRHGDETRDKRVRRIRGINRLIRTRGAITARLYSPCCSVRLRARIFSCKNRSVRPTRRVSRKSSASEESVSFLTPAFCATLPAWSRVRYAPNDSTSCPRPPFVPVAIFYRDSSHIQYLVEFVVTFAPRSPGDVAQGLSILETYG